MQLKIIYYLITIIIKDREWLKYAEEADILNVALFNTTAKKDGENLIRTWQKNQMLEIMHQ